MKQFLTNIIEAFATSKKHLIGFPISLVVSYLFGRFNITGWNELYYIDEWFGKEFTLTPLIAQSLIVLILAFGANWMFEYFQQKGLEEKPTRLDTLLDTLYFTLSAYFGFIVSLLILCL